MTTYQAHFHTGNGAHGAFLYYVREPIQCEDDSVMYQRVARMAQVIADREQVPVKIHVETWDMPMRRFDDFEIVEPRNYDNPRRLGKLG